MNINSLIESNKEKELTFEYEIKTFETLYRKNKSQLVDTNLFLSNESWMKTEINQLNDCLLFYKEKFKKDYGLELDIKIDSSEIDKLIESINKNVVEYNTYTFKSGESNELKNGENKKSCKETKIEISKSYKYLKKVETVKVPKISFSIEVSAYVTQECMNLLNNYFQEVSKINFNSWGQLFYAKMEVLLDEKPFIQHALDLKEAILKSKLANNKIKNISRPKV